MATVSTASLVTGTDCKETVVVATSSVEAVVDARAVELVVISFVVFNFLLGNGVLTGFFGFIGFRVGGCVGDFVVEVLVGVTF